jgi:23S rRNA (uracil1939-C5)-methyltransferase
VELLEGKAETALSHIEGGVDLLVLAPPRSGAGRRVVGEMARLSPRRVVYVSRDPATLARDARHLSESGYRLQEVQLVDLFPQTYHIESVALFVREAQARPETGNAL